MLCLRCRRCLVCRFYPQSLVHSWLGVEINLTTNDDKVYCMKAFKFLKWIHSVAKKDGWMDGWIISRCIMTMSILCQEDSIMLPEAVFKINNHI